MFFLLSALWFFCQLKYVLFWLYLWQLKDYHTGRVLDHFRTSKGKKAILSIQQAVKLVLLGGLFINDSFFIYILDLLILVYAVDFVFLIKNILNKSVKKPVATFKILFLLFISVIPVVWFVVWAASQANKAQLCWLIVFDILTPLVISAIVLLFQPVFVLIRINNLLRAADKIKKIKVISGLRVIAITGSYGKTSTKEFLATILAKKFKVLETSKNQNSEIGIAKRILNDLKPQPGGYPQIFIAEVGAYNKGKVKEVCSMIKPEIGIVTGINEQHVSLFGSMENLLSAEGGGELVAALPKDGMLVVNGDNKYCLNLYKETENLSESHKKIYCLDNKIINSDIWADSIMVGKDSVSFLALDKAGEMAGFNINVLGKQNVQNFLGVILVAKELGMSFGEIAEACKNITPEMAGMTIIKGKHNIDIIDSSYSSNPDGVLADLEYLSIFPKKRTIVMPCLIELGEKSIEIHEKIGKKIAETCDLAIITSKDKFVELKKAAMLAGMKSKNILLCDKARDIKSIIMTSCTSGDAILLEGRVPAELIYSLKI